MTHPEIALAREEARREAHFEAIRNGEESRSIATREVSKVAPEAELVFIEGLLAGYVYESELSDLWIAIDLFNRFWSRRTKEDAIGQLEMVAVACYSENVMP